MFWFRSTLYFLLAGCAIGQQLSLSDPKVRACGFVEVGGAFNAPGLQLVAPTWDWGDGTVTHSFFPAIHRYLRDGRFTIKTSIIDGSTVVIAATVPVTVAGSGAPHCGDLLMVDPPRVKLTAGNNRQTITVSRVNPVGERTIIAPGSLKFTSLAPALVSVPAPGVLSATGFGDTLVDVEDAATGQVLRVNVTAGNLRLDPPYLRLHLSANPEAKLSVSGTNADGSALNLTGRRVEFVNVSSQPTNPVISLSAIGAVHALRVPAAFNDSPFILARVDNVTSDNGTLVRVANAFPDISFFEMSAGMIRFLAARQVGNWNYEEMLRKADVAKWTDRAFELEAEAAGYRTDRGGVQNLVNDVGGTETPNDPTVPCGSSGNPTRLGSDPAKSVDNSCLIYANDAPMPQWFVYFHEMGHNYAGQNALFNQWIANVRTPFLSTVAEGMASAFAQYAAAVMRSRQAEYGLPAGTLRDFEMNAALPDSQRWRDALDQYRATGAKFASFSPDAFDGITGALMQEFGTQWFARLMSALSSPDAHYGFDVADDGQAATFMAASFSAAADVDLRDRFKTWGFPIDSVYYSAIYPELFQRSKARAPVIASGGAVNAASFKGTGVAPGEWISVFGTNLAPRLAVGSNIAANLEGTSIEFVDSARVSRNGLLQFVSADHLNVLVPEQMSTGQGSMRLSTWAGSVVSSVTVEWVQAGIFSAGASGSGPAAATWLRVKADGLRTSGLTFDPATLKNVPVEVGGGDQVYLSFFGTGFRGQQSVAATFGGQPVAVLAAVAQGQFAGLDQLIIGPIPATLAGKGEVELVSTFDGKAANRVTVAVQ
jgi:uncharacterized protein (TIGR03437 family)